MIKDLLSSLNIDIEETCFLKSTQLPFIIYDDDISTRGADTKLCIKEHSVSVYLCMENIDNELVTKIERLLNEDNYECSKDTYYDEAEGFYRVTYEFDYIEKG